MTILALRRCICSVGTKKGRYKFNVRVLFWLVVGIGLLVWAGLAHEIAPFIFLVFIFGITSVPMYGYHRKKGHTFGCSARQAILDSIEMLGEGDPPTPKADEAAFPAAKRHGIKIYSAPAASYLWRNTPQGLILFMFSFLGAMYIFMPSDSDITLIRATAAILLSTAIGLIPWAAVMKHRPYLVADETGMDLVVDKFFRDRAMRWAYAFKGYGDDYLPFIVDFAIPLDIKWEEVKYFKIDKRYFLYRLRVIVPGRKGIFLCSRYSKKKLKIIKRELELLKQSSEKK